MPSIIKINELDRKIQGNLNRLDSSMHKIVKTLDTIKLHDLDSSRIDKIEEIIDTLGTTFSSIKTKKVETPAKKEPKPVYDPKVPRPKINPSFAKGVETVKTGAFIKRFSITLRASQTGASRKFPLIPVSRINLFQEVIPT